MEFTAAQQAAIDHVDGNLQLIACAGSGKTEVVAVESSRYCGLQIGGGGCQPQNIIAFTFTDKAAVPVEGANPRPLP
ncbi:MAG: UvrD-helicase domain-containing protein [Woeseiaceae bacterium]|nr:UvrD-helicase domain-containing protein [Woeseiaceae bacterium]